MSDTPRTDAAFFNPMSIMYDPVSEMKILERELNAANQIAKKYEDRYFEALERIKRLEQAGDALKAAGYFGGWGDAVNKWIKVRESKP